MFSVVIVIKEFLEPLVGYGPTVFGLQIQGFIHLSYSGMGGNYSNKRYDG